MDLERYDKAKCELEDVATIREKYGVPNNWSMLLFVGRLSWVKGVRNLLLAMPSVLKEYPNTILVILGKGEEQRDIVETADRFRKQRESCIMLLRTFAYSLRAMNPLE